MDLPPSVQVSRMISSLWIPAAIGTAATLGVADALADGPKRSEEVARAVGAHPRALERLLRALVVLGLCNQTDGGGFALTSLGECLRTGVRDSVRDWALVWAGERTWRSWAHLVDCVRTGDTAPKLLEGVDDPFTFLTGHPTERAVFDRSMVEMTKPIAGAVAMAYDFSGIRTLVDVGGGYGALLPPILKTYPDVRAVVFDLPQCREGAVRLAEKLGLAARCEFVAGSFFEAVAPAGADAYIPKSVIHDWDDERSVAILRNCRAAMGPRSRLLVAEWIVPDRLGTSPLYDMLVGADLNMLVMTSGIERTEAEYRALLAAAGLRVTRIVPTVAALSVIEAEAS